MASADSTVAPSSGDRYAKRSVAVRYICRLWRRLPPSDSSHCFRSPRALRSARPSLRSAPIYSLRHPTDSLNTRLCRCHEQVHDVFDLLGHVHPVHDGVCAPYCDSRRLRPPCYEPLHRRCLDDWHSAERHLVRVPFSLWLLRGMNAHIRDSAGTLLTLR